MPHAAGLYYEWHGEGTGEPLILSSGLGGSGHYWRPNIAALAEKRRVLVYDHRGTGRSEHDVPGVLTLETLGEDIVGLMNALDIARATLVGHAIGGMAGIAVALAHPGRLSRLVVINGWARLDLHTARCFDTRMSLLRHSGPRAYLHAQPLFLYPPEWISAHHERLEAEEEVLLADFPGIDMIERRVAAARTFDVIERLGMLEVPVLLVASDDDMLVPPACSERMAARLAQGRLVRMARGGHACNVTRADHFTMWLLDWLDWLDGE